MKALVILGLAVKTGSRPRLTIKNNKSRGLAVYKTGSRPRLTIKKACIHI